MFEIGPYKWIVEYFTFPHKHNVAHRQNLIHHENIQIRGVVGDNDYWFVREFRTVLLHKNEKQNAQQIAPKQKHRRTPFAGFRAQDQQRCDGVKHKQGKDEDRVGVDFVKDVEDGFHVVKLSYFIWKWIIFVR